MHLALPAPQGDTLYTRGHFKYFHYGCDGTLDTGWGCGYRTLQTAISWIINRRPSSGNQAVPSIREIQRMLVNIGDKLPPFIDSRDWIGTLEEFYVIDYMFELPCKIVHAQQLNSDRGIAGINQSPASGVSLLIVDPHFSGVPSSKQQLIDEGYVRWRPISEFPESAYNLCFILQQ
ncbi:hypothetical protein ACLKA6_002392 [Drosophila palustris]